MLETTAELTAAMAAGEERAVEVFYRRYFDWLYRQARRVSGRDEAFCLDVVQDAVLRVMRTVRKVESENQFRGWMTLVVQTTAYDLMRSEGRRKKREMMVAAGREELMVAADGRDQQRLDWLWEQIAGLDRPLAKILELRLEQRWSLRRIAGSLGVSVGTIDGRIRRALRRIKLDAIAKFDDA